MVSASALASELGLTDREAIFVGTQEALSEHLGVDRKSVQRWQKRKDCPGKTVDGYDVKAWKAFTTKAGLGRQKTRMKAKDSLELEKASLENEKRRLMNEKLRGDSMHVDEVCKTLSEMMAGFVLSLRKIKHELASEVVGLSPGEATKRIGREVDDALEQLALGEWAQKKTFWSKVYAELRALQETYSPGSGPSSM